MTLTSQGAPLGPTPEGALQATRLQADVTEASEGRHGTRCKDTP